MKTKKSNNLYRKARPGWEAKVVNRSGLEKDGGAKNRKKWKFDKLKEGGILQFSLEGKFIREYSSVKEATKVLKISYATIHYCLTGRRKTGGNFQWRYKIDPNFDEGILDIPPMINRWTFKLQPVVQYTMEGKFVKEYSSIKEAAEILAVTVTSIAQCAKRKEKSTKGYQWRLKKDVSKDGKIIDIEPVKEPSRRAVCKFDMEGKFIQEYPSMAEAARDEGVSPQAISSRLEIKKCRDYQWRFKEEVEKDGKITDIDPVKPAPNRFHRPVCQFGRDGKFLREYSSIFEAGKDLEIDHEAIYRCLKGFQKTAGDFLWRYKKDPNFEEGISDIPPLINRWTFNLQSVVQYTLEGKFVKKYASIKEAAEIFAVPPTLIKQCTKGEKKSTKGYQWRLKKDVIKDGKIMDIEPVKKPSGLAVCKFDMDGKFIRGYLSMSEAARDEGVSKEAISSRLERKKCRNYQWRFKKEVEKDGKIKDIAPLKKIGSKFIYPVYQFGLDGTFIREYPSIIDAAEKTNIARYSIFSCAAKELKSTGGFQWQFKKEVVKKDGKIIDIAPYNRSKQKIKYRYSYPVCQFGLDGTFIREYPSIIEAAEKTNAARYSIFSCAAKKLKSTGGFQWRFIKEVVKKDGKITDIGPVKSMSPLYFRAVCQFKPGGKFIREYPSIIEAAEKTNIVKSRILACVVKKYKSSGGFKWRLTEEVVKKKKDRKKMAIKRVKRDPSHYLRAVCQFKQDGTLVREYPSINEASKKTNIIRSLIFFYASKKIKKRDGSRWRFKEDVVKKDGIIKDIEPARPVPSRYLRAVCQFEKNGKFIREYSSILDAAKESEAYEESIYGCTQKKQKTTAGFQWRLKEEVVNKDGKIRDIEPARPVLPHFLRAVCQFKQDGTLVREYPSIYEASEKTDITRSVIFSNASRKAKNRDGSLWRFKEDVVDKDGKISNIDTRKPVQYRFLRPVCQFGRDGKFLREYPNILDAAQKTSIYEESILRCVQRIIKLTGGFQWRYKDDPEFKNGITDIAPYERKESRRRIKKKQ